jgi:hypothetical protein
VKGFTTWCKLNSRIQGHENSPAHRSAVLVRKQLGRVLNKLGLTDDHLQQDIAEKDKKWEEIL